MTKPRAIVPTAPELLPWATDSDAGEHDVDGVDVVVLEVEDVPIEVTGAPVVVAADVAGIREEEDEEDELEAEECPGPLHPAKAAASATSRAVLSIPRARMRPTLSCLTGTIPAENQYRRLGRASGGTSGKRAGHRVRSEAGAASRPLERRSARTPAAPATTRQSRPR